ncbi:MAG: anthranilate synthase component I family protein [Bacteroidia bacterium]|nr:anthranilate synthase component I family protein [Bacteroidia bacterium]
MKLKTYYTQVNLDLHTPVSAYLHLRDTYAGSLLLESSDHHSKEGNFSFIACNPISSFKVEGNSLQILKHDRLETKNIDKGSLEKELSLFVSSFETDKLLVSFPYSAVFGYSSFDVIDLIDDHTSDLHRSEIPVVHYTFYSLLLVFDHAKHQAHVVSFGDSISEANKNSKLFIEQLNASTAPSNTFETIGEISSSTTPESYIELAQKAKQHCKLGDVFQLVLSRRFKQKFIGDEFNVYRCLKQINPSPYLFFFDMGSFKLFGSSPEAQLVVKDSIAEIHPIAGTYKRSGNDELDKIAAQKLMSDRKENSEHYMLVDLARNDLSTCCNDVKVERLKELQFFSHVIHLVSKVTGKLKKGVNGIELLYRSFPAGTLSGAPKHKALQLIRQYETEPRNFYGGCVGFIETNGNVNHAIMIRSFLSIQNELHFQAGAGIVIDSKPENELAEIDHKTSALKKALKEANKLNIIPTFTEDETLSA